MPKKVSSSDSALQIQKVVPVSGDTIVIEDGNNDILLSLSPVDILDTLGVGLPSDPYDGQFVYISTTYGINSFVLSSNFPITGSYPSLEVGVSFVFDGDGWRKI